MPCGIYNPISQVTHFVLSVSVDLLNSEKFVVFSDKCTFPDPPPVRRSHFSVPVNTGKRN